MGDAVTIKGEVTQVSEDPNFVNCTVKLMQTMPPSGAEINLPLNTAQLEKVGGEKPQQTAPQHAGAKK